MGRIIRATRPSKSDLDQEKLRADLVSARALYLTGKEYRKDGKKVLKKLASLETAVRRVQLLLADEPAWKKIVRHQRHTEQDPRQLAALLRIAIERPLSYHPPAEPAWATQFAREYIEALGVRERSAFEWLVGQHLPQLYKGHFDDEAKFSRNTLGVPVGPYISFAKQALIELGITNRGEAYSEGAIAKALGDVRKGRVRRKKDALGNQKIK